MVEIQSNRVKIPNGSLEIESYLATPTTGVYPGIIVIQEIFGVNSHIRDITDRIAQLGYVAIAPAIYQRIAPGFEAGYSEADLEEGRKYKNQTQADQLLGDIRATIDYLYSLPQVKAEGVGTIGFCFGGHVVYLTATLPQVKAAACFYGAGIVDWCPGDGKPTIERTPQIKGRLYGFFGTEDPLIPLADVDKVEAALQQAGVDHRIFRYEGATHGFMCDQRDSYNETVAQAAWQQVQELFDQTLRNGN